MIEDLLQILNYLRMAFEIPGDGFCDVLRAALPKTFMASKTGFIYPWKDNLMLIKSHLKSELKLKNIGMKNIGQSTFRQKNFRQILTLCADKFIKHL